MKSADLMLLAKTLRANAIPLLAPRRDESPEMIGHALGVIDDLPGALEQALAEVEALDLLAAERERSRRAVGYRIDVWA